MRFFTDGLDSKIGIDKAHTPVRAIGSVNLESNREKGIKSTGTVKFFHSMKELPKAIESTLEAGNIVVMEK